MVAAPATARARGVVKCMATGGVVGLVQREGLVVPVGQSWCSSRDLKLFCGSRLLMFSRLLLYELPFTADVRRQVLLLLYMG